MNRASVTLPLIILVASGLSGCLVEETTGAPAQASPQDATPDAKLLALLGSLPPPEFDRMKAVDWWERFVKNNDMRQWPLPKNVAAAVALEAELKASGFQTRIMYHGAPYPAGQPPIDLPVGFMVVQGLKGGTAAKDHRLALIAHFDTVPTTQQGAYDDGSGTAAELEICKLLAKVPTNKTIECLFFNNEENGLLASQAYTNWYVQNKPQWVWDQGFGYDMTGLNWPGYAKWKLFAMVGTQHDSLRAYTDAHAAFLDVLAYDFLGPKMNVTTDGVEVLKVHDRNSDEQSFKRIGIPVVRFAGGRRAADYPQYHKSDDTVEFVYRFACECSDLAKGKEAFAAGYEMVVLASYYTILAYDRYDPKALPF